MKPRVADALRGILHTVHEVAPELEQHVIAKVQEKGAEIELVGKGLDFCADILTKTHGPIGEQGKFIAHHVQRAGRILQRKP